MSALQSMAVAASAARAGRGGPIRPRRLRAIGARGECPRESVLALLEEHAQNHPLNHALVMLDAERAGAVTYLELARRVKRITAWLSTRFPEGGQPVAILSEPSPAWGIVALATIASRNVLVPLDTSMEPDALEAILTRIRPVVLAGSAKRLHATDAYTTIAAHACQRLCFDASRLDVTLPASTAKTARSAYPATPATAVLAFTSGTTAEPKGVEIGIDNLLFQIRALTRCFALRPSDRLLSLLPMHHMFEFTAGFLCPLWAGAEVHYLPSLLPHDALKSMRTLGITRAVTVPAWLALLKRSLEHSARTAGGSIQPSWQLRSHARQAFGNDFQHFVCGGAPLADEIADFFDTVGAPVIQGYGLTETSPVVATNTMSECRRGSVGQPLSGTETAISNEGEILVRGPQVAARYQLNAGAAESIADEEGWFHTGDLGHLDSDGFLFVTGRIKTTIVLANGKNVQPEEIEAIVEGCDAVAEAGVVPIGESDSARGEEICLVAVAAPAFRDACLEANDDVAQKLNTRIGESLVCLAGYKRPRRVLLCDQPLPRTASGKLRRPALAAWAQAQSEKRS